MPQFPNYSMNSYPQFNNQMYQPSYPQMQQYQNPYMDRMMQMQNQQMPQTNQNPIIGKIVESVDMVKATDIPMDGSMYYFPTADGSLVFGKQWLPNGQTRILTFKPVSEEEPNNLSVAQEKFNISAFSEVLECIQNEIRLINEKIDKIPKPTKVKREEQTNE